MPFGGRARLQSLAAGRGALRLGFSLEPGMRIGLYGGSFNPAHDGHAHVAETALKRLDLHRVIWLVSPQNPLKQKRETASLEARMEGARAIARGPRMIVSDAETRLGTQYTLDVIRIFQARFPGVHFVWIMGADSLLTFHRWRGWTQIMQACPVAVVSRPWAALKSRFSPAARRFAHARAPSHEAKSIVTRDPPAWVYLRGRFNFSSSTALRKGLARPHGS